MRFPCCLKGICLLILLLPALRLSAEAPKPDVDRWENLQSVRPGTTVRVVLNDAKSYTGTLHAVRGETIIISEGEDEKTFDRRSILRVWTKGESRRMRNALIGLAVGAAAGAVIGAASPELGQGTCSSGSCRDAGTIAVVATGGGLVGAGVGAAIPTGGWRDVYRAR